MLTAIIPKLPMRDKAATRRYYTEQLGFAVVGDHDHYLLVERDGLELHFFLFAEMDPMTNDGQVYIRTDDIDVLHRAFVGRGVAIHPNGGLQTKPWGQREFSLLDPDHNLLTFGQAL